MVAQARFGVSPLTRRVHMVVSGSKLGSDVSQPSLAPSASTSAMCPKATRALAATPNETIASVEPWLLG